ncbi:dihydrodipicolinate synthase family protein, partial [Pseudomonas aeruginosa]
AMANVLPKGGDTTFGLARAARFAVAMPIYEWLAPMLHLAGPPDLVQSNKCCEQLAGLASAPTRPPRLPLRAADREHVGRIIA